MGLKNTLNSARALVGRPRPIILSHKLTTRCDCRCQFCDFWKDQNKKEVETEKILDLIDRAAAAGMTCYTAWGGEPLLCDNLPKYLERARSRDMITTICTAGYRLAERAPEIGPYLSQTLLSLEGVGEKQDEIRRTPGLFERLSAGVDELKKHSESELVIWANLSSLNKDQPEGIVEFAREKGAAVEFFPAARYDDYNDELVLGPEEREEVFNRIIEMKKQGEPIYNSYYSLKMMADSRPFKCNRGRLSVLVDSKGIAWACEERVIPGLEPYGNAMELDFESESFHTKYLDNIDKLSNCNACLLPCVSNMADNLIAQVLRRSWNGMLLRSQGML